MEGSSRNLTVRGDRISEVKRLIKSQNIIHFYIRKKYGAVLAWNHKGSTCQLCGVTLWERWIPESQQDREDFASKEEESTGHFTFSDWLIRLRPSTESEDNRDERRDSIEIGEREEESIYQWEIAIW